MLEVEKADNIFRNAELKKECIVLGIFYLLEFSFMIILESHFCCKFAIYLNTYFIYDNIEPVLFLKCMMYKTIKVII